MSFKGNIDDFRYSFGIYLAADLVKMGYGVFVHDPFMGQNYYNTPHPDLDVEICDNLEGCIPEVDKVIFGTNHRGRFVFELFWTLGKLLKSKLNIMRAMLRGNVVHVKKLGLVGSVKRYKEIKRYEKSK